MTPNPRPARWLVLAIIAVILSLGALVTFGYGGEVAPDDHLQDTIRFVLLAILGIFLFRGTNWARWTSIALLLSTGVLSLIAGVIKVFETPAALLFLVAGILYVTAGVVLLRVASVRAYFGADPGETRPGG